MNSQVIPTKSKLLNTSNSTTIIYTANHTPIPIEEVKGSVYLDDSFSKGKIISDLTKASQNVYLRYNLYRDIFEVKYNLADEEILDFTKAPDSHAEYHSNKFYLKSYKDHEGVLLEGYLQQLHTSETIALYKRYYQKFHDPKPAKTSYEQDIPGKLTNQISYYVLLDNNLVLMNSKRSKILNSFPKHTKKLKAFIKEKKLKFKNDKDFVQLIQYYDSLNG